MTHRDSGWRPDVGLDTYDGFELWDHDMGPHQMNDGELDVEVEFPDEILDALED